MIRIMGLAATAIAAMAMPALAAEEHHQGGLPQLQFSTYPSQIFWLIVSFTLLYFLMKRSLPRVTEILETRHARIQADLDRAAALRAEAEDASSRFDKVLSDAQQTAGQKMRETNEKAAAALAERQAKVDAEIEVHLKSAEDRIRTARNSALAEIGTVAAEVAQSAVKRLAGIEIGLDEAKAVVAGAEAR